MAERVSRHGRHDAVGETPAEVLGDDFVRTCANGQPMRNHDRAYWRAVVKQIAKNVAGALHGIVAALRPAGIEESHARKLINVQDPLPLALGDVMAADPEWAEGVLSECLELVRGRSPVNDQSLERIQRLIARDAGTFADVLDKALLDGKVTREEAREMLRVLRQLRGRCDDAIARLEVLL